MPFYEDRILATGRSLAYMNSQPGNEFEQARLKHQLFMSKLRAILLGALINEEPVLSEHECPFGKWIQTFALKNCSHVPELKELERIHTDMHRVARTVVRHFHTKKEEEAAEGMQEIEKMSERLLVLLSALSAKC